MNAKLREEINKRLTCGTIATDIDLHVHTFFSDGENSAEEIVLTAIEKGIKVLGFSDHSYIQGEAWCMTPKQENLYRKEIAGVKERFKDRIDIYCGVEQDSLSGKADPYYDYVIGSAHAVKAGDGVVWVDNTPEAVQDAVERYYDGDYYKYAETYYDGVAEVFADTGCDIVGHFDLLTKFNEGDKLFSTSHPRYINAWKHAADRLIEKNLIFEINTGAISRGYRKAPYPSSEIIAYLKEKGASVILCSDSHNTNTLAFQFDRWNKVF